MTKKKKKKGLKFTIKCFIYLNQSLFEYLFAKQSIKITEQFSSISVIFVLFFSSVLFTAKEKKRMTTSLINITRDTQHAG